EPKLYQPPQCGKNSAAVRTHDHGATQGNLPRMRRAGREELLFPTFGDIDTEIPGLRHSGLSAAEFSAHLVHLAIKRMSIDGGSGGVHPQRRWIGRLCDSLANDARRENPGIDDLAPVPRVIAAVHAASCEIDHNIGGV